VPHRPKSLEFEDVSGAGLQIKAELDFAPDFIEYKLRPGKQTILHGKPGKDQLIAYEPWTQFSPEEWDKMLAQVFKEMVDLWNIRYANIDRDADDLSFVIAMLVNAECHCPDHLKEKEWHEPGCAYRKCQNILDLLEKRRVRRGGI
jgi:hypothetical protein